MLEGQRALLEGMTLRPAAPLLRSSPRGDGHPVLVLPGFTAGDTSTRPLRQHLRRLGYSAHGWRLGPNLGPGGGVREGMIERLDELATRHGRKVTLVGWSLGGIYARELAKGLPAKVRQVVTLGSPFGDAGNASNVRRLFDLVAGPQRRRAQQAGAASLRAAPPVPSTAIYSRTDGVVHWRSCQEPEGARTENIEVPGSHCGLGVNPLVLYAVADRLAQPESGWQPFERSGWRRRLYR